tara:strand:- start:950 stop:2161 length:1212 start_codon:yes stop_codon:yes gene_type:complete
MFRGGRVSAYGTGIAHGLADGGMAPDGRQKFFEGGISTAMMNELTGGSNFRTGGNLLKSNMTPFQQGLYGQNVQMPNWMRTVGNWLKPGRIAGLASRTGLGTLPLLYAGGAKILQESLPEELQGEGGIADRVGYGGAMAAGADYAGTGVDEVLAGEVDMTKYENVDKTVTGIEGPAGIEPIADEFKEIEVGNETGEPLELSAKDMIRENKKLFADLLGADKARGQDISDMLLGFAGAEGDTTREKFQKFAAAEAKRPGKLEKVNETAAALAINDYIAGKKSKRDLETILAKTKFGVDYQIAASGAMSDLNDKSWTDSLLTVFNEYKGREDIRGTKVIGDTLYRKFKKPVQVLAKYGKKSKEDIMEDKADDFIEGFNIVIHKNGKSIIEKIGEQLIDRSNVLPI